MIFRLFEKPPLKSNFYLIFNAFWSISFSFLVASCGNNNKLPESEKVINSKPFVLATFTVIADIAKNVAGNRLTIDSITKTGQEIHGYQPTPSDIVKATKADLIIENGLGLELWARKFTAAAGIPTVVLTKGMKPLLIEGDLYSGKPNPHAWMSPKRSMNYVDILVNTFSELDPEGSNFYKQNGDSYKEKLRILDQELRQTLEVIPLEKRVLVTCEGAFSYLAHDYGMKEAYLWPVNSESQVTPKRMLRLINLVRSRNVPAIFCESTVNSKPQKEVARISGAKYGGTFYVDSLSPPDGPAPSLLELQRHNVRLIKQGLLPAKLTK
tara:strand:+ start:335 stop:1309 length:975 start_codon:yes stop_codon:yes gene_type:complete